MLKAEARHRRRSDATTAEGASLRPEGLGARPHGLGPGVAARPRKLLPIQHRAILDSAVGRSARGRRRLHCRIPAEPARFSAGGIVPPLLRLPSDGLPIRMLGIGTIAEEVVMLGRGPIPRTPRGQRFVVGASKPFRQAGVAIRHAMTMLAASLTAAAPADLEPLREFLARRRTREFRVLTRGLRSARFRCSPTTGTRPCVRPATRPSPQRRATLAPAAVATPRRAR